MRLMSFVLVVASFALSSVSLAQGGETPKCKTPEILKEIARLEEERDLANDALKVASALADEAQQRLVQCQARAKAQGKGTDACAAEQQEYSERNAAVSTAGNKWVGLVIQLDRLARLPACPQTQTPPPPPPPKPTPDPQPPQQTLPPEVSPTHRITLCPPCIGLERALNKAADNYAEAVRRRDPDQTIFRQQMADYSRQLDECEKQCIEPPSVPGVTRPEPPKDRPAPPKQAPALPGSGATVPGAGSSVFTHRQTACGQCQSTADRFNQSVDRHAEAVRSNAPHADMLRKGVETLSHALDACEQRCTPHAAPPLPHVGPGPTNQPGGGPNGGIR